MIISWKLGNSGNFLRTLRNFLCEGDFEYGFVAEQGRVMINFVHGSGSKVSMQPLL